MAGDHDDNVFNGGVKTSFGKQMSDPTLDILDLETGKKQHTLKELVLLEEIEDFINRMQLTTDEMILRYIYPKFFKERMREKFMSQYESQH